MVPGSLMGKLFLEITIFVIVSSTNFLVISVNDLHVYTLIRFQQWSSNLSGWTPVSWRFPCYARFTIHVWNPPCLRVQFMSTPMWINCNVWGWNSRFFLFKLSEIPIFHDKVTLVQAFPRFPMALFEPRHLRRSFEKASGLVEALIGAVQQVRCDKCGRLKQTWWNLDATVPSGYVKIAIENGHWNSEFSH